jgi:hypothetical protein
MMTTVNGRVVWTSTSGDRIEFARGTTPEPAADFVAAFTARRNRADDEHLPRIDMTKADDSD